MTAFRHQQNSRERRSFARCHDLGGELTEVRGGGDNNNNNDHRCKTNEGFGYMIKI